VTFDTPVGTLSVFGTLGSYFVIFDTSGTVGTFGTPVAFGKLRIGSVFSTLGIMAVMQLLPL